MGGWGKQADGLDHFVWGEVSWCNAHTHTHVYTTKKYPVVSHFKVFLAVHNSSIGLIVPCLLGLTKLTIRAFTTLQSDPRDL